MALNPQFPNYANGPAGTEVIGWTIVGGQPLYRLPVAYVDTGFGAAFVCEGSTIEAPTYPEGVYTPDPGWESAGSISGTPAVGQTLTFTPGTPIGTAPITTNYNWIRYIPGGTSVVVGSGLNYSPVTADLTHPLVVQSVATNANGSVATQTLPFGPINPAPPVITNAGTLTSIPPNPTAPPGTIYPTQTADLSNVVVTGFSPQVSWVWGYGTGADFQPIQLGGDTFSPVPASAVGKTIYVKVTATNTGGTVTAFSNGLQVDGAAPSVLIPPKIGPQVVVVGDTVTGAQGRWTGYPTPQVTDWGFAEFLLPTPAPIAGANKVYTYVVPQALDGKQIVFYVTATNSEGSTTAYSLPTDAVYDELKPDRLPTLTGFQSPAQFGDVITGTLGTFDPPDAYQYSYFAYANGDGSLTEIAGTRGTTTYTLGVPDLGKEIVYASYAANTGKYGPETLTTRSNSTGTIRRFLKMLTPGTLTFTGPAPLIESTCQAVAGTFSPALGTAPAPVLSTIQVGYLQNGSVPVYFDQQVGGWTSPYSFVVPDEADGSPLFFDYTVNYTDYVGAPIQTVRVQRVGLTPPAEGVAPFRVTAGQFNPANVYNAGQTIAYTPSTYNGVPTPTVTWQWYLGPSASEIGVMVQNGGLTYVLPDDSQGKWVSIIEFARNQAGSVAYSPASQQIGGPLPVWTRLPVITGNPLMTPTQGTTLNGIIPQARDPITNTPLPVTWQWMAQYPGQTPIPLGHPFTTFDFANENGRWTGAQIYIQGTATNAIGTVTCESNRIQLLGTPRIISQGAVGAGGFGISWRMSYTPCTYDGGGQTFTTSWQVVATIGATTDGFANPTTSSPLSFLPPGTGTVSASQEATNAQGATTFSAGPQSFTKI
jgi:hypothetical protein